MPNTIPPNERRRAALQIKTKHVGKFQRFLNSSLWKLLNSNLFLFILGTLIVTSVTNCISNNIQEKQVEIEKRKEANRYLIEYQYRVFKLTNAVDAIAYAYEKTLKAEKSGYVDSNSFKVIGKYRRYLLDIINGTGSYRPLESGFKDQHLTSIVSWFGFNMKEPRNMHKEIEAIYGLEGSFPWGMPKLDVGENYRNMTTLFDFLIEAQEYIHDFKFDRTKKVPLIKRPIFQ